MYRKKNTKQNLTSIQNVPNSAKLTRCYRRNETYTHKSKGQIYICIYIIFLSYIVFVYVYTIYIYSLSFFIFYFVICISQILDYENLVRNWFHNIISLEMKTLLFLHFRLNSMFNQDAPTANLAKDPGMATGWG